MSLLKRKIFSLDPIEKQKKSRQIEYFMLIDKCLQIPNDDKLILRKNVQSEDQSLLSLLEKYRKQGSKDLKQLQIYLRKFIQRFKAQNPKYPTLKIGRGSESCVSFNKRSSFSFSVSTSKLSYNLNNSHAQKFKNGRQNLQTSLNNSRNQMSFSKSKFSTPLKSERENYFGIVPKNFQKNNTKNVLKLNTSYCREDEKNYEELIKKRKTQKLKIQANRVSVTIENQSLSPLNNVGSIQKAKKNDDLKSRTEYSLINDSFMNVNDSHQTSIQPAKNSNPIMKESGKPTDLKNEQLQNSKIEKKTSFNIQQDIQKGEFLSIMSFKMKIDEPEEQLIPHQKNIQSRRSSIKSTFLESDNFIVTRSSLKNQNNHEPNQLKRRLFDSSSSKSNQYSSDQIQKSIKKPLQSIQNTLKQIKFQNKDSLSVNSSQTFKNKQKEQFKEFKRGKENFNSGQKFSNNQSLVKQSLNHTLLQSQVKSINQNISQLSTINKSNNQNNEISNFYLLSQRNPNQTTSRRSMEGSKAFVKSFIRERDEKSLKQSKSSRMQFSNRMEEIISGRTEKAQTSAAPSFSNRQKIQGANKLAFWARIQSTINE